MLERRKHSKKGILLPRAAEEAWLPSPLPSSRDEGLASSPVPVLSREEALDMVYSFVLASVARGEELLLASPTVTAYEAEGRLLTAVDEGTTEEGLASLLTQYLEAHRMTQQGEPWTGEDVPLYYLTVKKDGRTVRGYTANGRQVRLLTELWRRKAEDAQLDTLAL